MVTIIETNYPSDIFNYIDERVCNECDYVQSPVALDSVEILGQPVKRVGNTLVLCVAGEEAQAIGLVYTKECLTMEANTNSKEQIAFAVRGNMVLNIDCFPENDVAGNPLDNQALAQRYSSLGDISIKDAGGFGLIFTQEGNQV